MDPPSCLAGSILKSIVAAARGRGPHSSSRGRRERRSRGPDVAMAVRRCDLCALERLVREEGADPDEGLGAATPLSLALTLGSFPCAEALLRLGSDPRRRSLDDQGRLEPPLVTAVRLGCPLALCGLLLDYGAHPDDRDFYGHSALWAAVYGKRWQHVQLLIDRGATVCEWGPGGERVPALWNESPLYEAARQGWQWCLPLVSAGAWGPWGALVGAARDLATVKGLVLAAGLSLPPSHECPHHLGWLRTEMSSPPPLLRLCRHRVRRCLSRAALGRDLAPRAPLLPLPPHLVRYVLLDPLGP